ncbi:MAG: hypothetical protein PF487_09335 [Bacteroidales bacterium]|nr:hypothetical protein [Bacteroidales bacterium]
MIKIWNWIVLRFKILMYYISMALYNTEIEILKADPNDLDEKNKKNQRMLNRNPLLEKFYQGQTDQKYVQDYYEVLKKADLFIKKSDKVQYGTAADKNGMSYGKRDKWGRRHEHYGFFDPKSKNYGKTLEEVLKNEMDERRTKDDDYELLEIYNNERIMDGLVNSLDVVETTDDGDKVLSNITKQIKKDKFPIQIIRSDESVVNKIEQLTDFLHVKRIDDEYRQLEFFIDIKYKTNKLSDDDKIFKELINIENVWVYNDYGELDSYKIENFKKRIIYNDTHEVFKFFCKKMDVIKK